MCCSPSFRWTPAAHWKTLCSPRNLWGFPQTPLAQRNPSNTVSYTHLDVYKRQTSIWSVEKVLYSINDFKLPFPITFTQMAWFVVSVFAVMLLGNLPPLSFIDGAFLKYFGVPFALTWFMCQKTFDGKKPYGFLKSVLAYLVRPKLTYAGKPVKLEKEYPAQPITAVRSDIYGISD